MRATCFALRDNGGAAGHSLIPSSEGLRHRERIEHTQLYFRLEALTEACRLCKDRPFGKAVNPALSTIGSGFVCIRCRTECTGAQGNSHRSATGQSGAETLAKRRSMRIALYQPDIPQNTGTILRLSACLGVEADLIGPAGFDFSDRSFRRAGLDYLEHVRLRRHESFEAFLDALENDTAMHRLVLLTTKSDVSYCDFQFRETDVLLLGRESAGVPETVHERADARVRIPILQELRSLNVAVAAAMVVGEALRQTGGFRQ